MSAPPAHRRAGPDADSAPADPADPDIPIPVPLDDTTLQQRERRDWLRWGLALLAVTTVVTGLRWSAFRETESAEVAALTQTGEALVQMIEQHLSVAQQPPQQAVPITAHRLEVDMALPRLAALLAAARHSSDLRIALTEAQGSLLAAAPAPVETLRWRQTWQPTGVAGPVTLTIEREREAVLQGWRERSFVAAAIWVTLFMLTGLFLALTHRRGRRDGAQLRQHAARMAQAQQSVQRSDERLRQVLRTARIGVFEHDHRTGTVFTTQEHNAIWGFDPQAQPKGMAYAERLHPEDRERVLAIEAQGHDPRGNGVFDSEHRIVRGDGELRWIRVRSQTLFEEVGDTRRPQRTIGGVTDITASRQAQDRLTQQAALLDRAPVAIDVRSVDNRLLYWNGGAERIYGWSAAEALGRDAAELLQQDTDHAAQVLERLLAQGEHAAILEERCRDGRTVQVDARFGLLRDAQGRPHALFSIKSDISQRLQLEAQLRHAQRLESLGQLTGGVAHDFNNLLTVIIGNAELLVETLDDRPDLKGLAVMAREAALRGAELTHGLLAFARRQPLQPRSVNVNEVLAGAEGLWRRTLRADIELELVRGAGLWPALIDPAQLESAILNLVINARDAMPHGGRITLETANAHIDQHCADQHDDVKRGQYVQVTLTDTGEGMGSEQLARAFEPFFTTKGVGKGSGLGLSMVYGFVKQSNGHVKLCSEPGLGTTVRLYLPRAGTDAAPAAEAGPAGVPGRAEATVLVVEDDEQVRRLAHQLLAAMGYGVLLAGNGAEALATLQALGRIDLLFTDVVMPGGMNGRELAERAVALRPGLKVLYTSGYTENAIVHQGRLDRGVQLLSKPYRRDDLARAIRDALAE